MPKSSHSYKKNQTVRTSIYDINDLGFGVGRCEGVVIFVADTVPGDVIDARIIKVNSSYLVGRVENFITRSPMRTENRCTECACKSCAYRNISYADELLHKEESVRRLFCTPQLAGIRTDPIVPSPTELRYRNKAQYPIALIGARYEVGFFAPKSHRVTPITDCPLTPPVFSHICDELKAFFKEYSLTVYDESTGEGLLRHIYLRRGELSGEILVTLVINGDAIPHSEALVDRLTKRFSNIVGILLNVNTAETNVVLGERYITLFGTDYMYDTLSGVRLKITAPSFYQVNHDCAEILYKKAAELAEPKKSDTLLDLYCGAGSIGLSMAEAVRELIGIEIIESAVLCARENAKANGICNAHFFTGDAKDTERLLESAEKQLGRKINPDIIILDPPRGGCDEKLIAFASSLNPRKIVYISCNPKTLARDVAAFKEHGYLCDSVTPVDMFPMTGHVESLACLTRRTS